MEPKGSLRHSQSQPPFPTLNEVVPKNLLGEMFRDFFRSLDSSVGIETMLRVGRSGVHISEKFTTALAPKQPPIQCIPGFFLGLKRPGRDANRSPPSSIDVKNGWSSTFASLTYIQGADRDKCNFHVMPSAYR